MNDFSSFRTLLFDRVETFLAEKKNSKISWARKLLSSLDGDRIPNLKKIFHGVQLARHTRLFALPAPDLLGGVDSHGRDSSSSIIEQLFQRLNQLGTTLEGEELAYSLIKAHWPEVSRIIENFESGADRVEKPMPSSRLIAMAYRVSQIDLNKKTFPAGISPNQVRALARDKDSASARAFLDYLKDDLKGDLWLLRDLLLFHPDQNPAGLLPVHIADIARHDPDTYLLLLFLMRRLREEGMDPYAMRGSLLFIATRWSWFWGDSKKAIRRNFSELVNSFFENELASTVKSMVRENILGPVFSPEEVQAWGPALVGDLSNWSWESIYKSGLSDEQVEIAVGRERFLGVRYSKNLLLYAQRGYIFRRFPDYDPARNDYWRGHNRPWDWDHILARVHIDKYKANHRYQKFCQQWRDTLGNLRAWPFEDNRSDLRSSAKEKIDDARKMMDSLIINETELECFSFDRAVIFEEEKTRAWAQACWQRFLRIYGEWYEEICKKAPV